LQLQTFAIAILMHLYRKVNILIGVAAILILGMIFQTLGVFKGIFTFNALMRPDSLLDKGV
jgi:hypothetical protein